MGIGLYLWSFDVIFGDAGSVHFDGGSVVEEGGFSFKFPDLLLVIGCQAMLIEGLHDGR